jgi:hypothetical protein
MMYMRDYIVLFDMDFVEFESVVCCTLIYMERYILKRSETNPKLQEHKITLDEFKAILTTCSRYTDDERIRNTDVSETLNINVHTLSKLQTEFLKQIDYNLLVKPSTYAWYKIHLVALHPLPRWQSR